VQNIMNIWTSFSMRNRVIVGLASLAVFLAVLSIGRMAVTPHLSLLYAGLEPDLAGQVINALEQRGVIHEVRGGAIYVENLQRDALRMSLAGEGLPATSAKGYELLENLTGFGTTAQMFDAAYWRAKEGELARTILANPAVSSVRVHIANATGHPFQQEIRPSASVTLTTKSGALQALQVRAIRSLVASAVAGMNPDDVSVIDSVIGLLTQGAEFTEQKVGDDRSEAFRERILRLIEARVGPGNAMVEVNITTEADSETVTERIIDPASRVAISTESEEETNSSDSGSNAAVTVASNLPDGEAQTNNGSRSSTNQTRERVNYEVSETTRAIQRGVGEITRITVAVLVNEVAGAPIEGEAPSQPRAESELQALRDLVASAVGFDENRGDVVTIKSMAFSTPAPLGTEVTAGLLQKMNFDLMSTINLLALVVVIIILGLFVIRPIFLSNAPQSIQKMPSALRSNNGVDEIAGPSPLQPLTGEVTSPNYLSENANISLLQDVTQSYDRGSESLDSVERLRNLIAERQDETVEILRGWLESKSEKV
jgi:flagellar M-ring protein FliF